MAKYDINIIDNLSTKLSRPIPLISKWALLDSTKDKNILSSYSVNLMRVYYKNN